MNYEASWNAMLDKLDVELCGITRRKRRPRGRLRASTRPGAARVEARALPARHVGEVGDHAVEISVGERGRVEAGHAHVGPAADRAGVANQAL